MIYYLVSYLLSVLSALIFTDRVRNKKRVIFVVLLFPTVILGLRNNCSIDDAMHQASLSQYIMYGKTLRTDLEFFFLVLLKVCKIFNFPIQFVYCVYAALTNFFLGQCFNEYVYVIKKTTVVFFCQLYYVFIFFDSMTIMRQMLAVGIMAYFFAKYRYYSKKNFALFSLVLILTTFIVHKTAIACLGWYVLQYMTQKFWDNKRIRASYIAFQFVFFAFVFSFDLSGTYSKLIRFLNLENFSYYFSENAIFKNNDIGFVFLGSSLVFYALQIFDLGFIKEKFNSSKLFIYFKMMLDSAGYLVRFTFYLAPMFYIYFADNLDSFTEIKQGKNGVEEKEAIVKKSILFVLFFVLFLLVLFSTLGQDKFSSYREYSLSYLLY